MSIIQLVVMEPFDRVEALMSGNCASPIDQEVLGSEFRHSDDQIDKAISSIPVDSELGRYRRNNWFLAAGPPVPMSLRKVYELIGGRYFHKITNRKGNKKDPFFLEDRERFAVEEMVNPGWIIIHRRPILEKMKDDHIISWNWNIQSKIISRLGMEVPNAATIAWVLTVCEAKGIHLFPNNVCVRTASHGSRGYRVLVGRSNSGGILISSSCIDDDTPNGSTGVIGEKFLPLAA